MERLDPDAECDALVPPRIPAPVTVHVDGEGLSCAGGLSEGGGHVAVLVRSYPDAEWQTFSPQGVRGQRFVTGSRSLAPQPDGWIVARSATPTAPFSVRVEWLSGDGTVRRSETPSPGFQVGWWTRGRGGGGTPMNSGAGRPHALPLHARKPRLRVLPARRRRVGGLPCRQVVELVAPSGRACVRLTFREDATGCSPRWIDQGWDGTVVQQSGKDPCTWRWWPGLLGGVRAGGSGRRGRVPRRAPGGRAASACAP